MTEAGGRAAGPSARPSAPPPSPAGPAAARILRVLIVEDEPVLRRALLINLRARGYAVSQAAAGREALAEAARQPPHAVILDLGLPDVDGTEVIRELRGWSRAPVIVLSGRTGSGDKIGALDAGADDYVTKPFSMAELLARLRAAMRREEPAGAASRATIGRWTVNLATYRVHSAGQADTARPGPAPADTAAEVHLTRTEWRLLEILLRRPGQLVSAISLLTDVWGPGYERSTHYLRFHMAGLRRKLEDDPARPRHLVTEPGMGYRYLP
jgi:two-component system KDP operon response regulator KdpE